MPRQRPAQAAANAFMTGSPPKAQHQNAPGSIPGVPTAPEPEKINIEEVRSCWVGIFCPRFFSCPCGCSPRGRFVRPQFACPGGCGYAKTWTHQTHCCTGCSRGEDHTNNCERKLWKGNKNDASAIKVQALCCEMFSGA